MDYKPVKRLNFFDSQTFVLPKTAPKVCCFRNDLVMSYDVMTCAYIYLGAGRWTTGDGFAGRECWAY